MAQLIDNTYFVRELALPGSALSGDLSNITGYIERFEREALIDLLGYTLYKDLKAEIDAGSYSTRWDRLVNGHEWTEQYAGDMHTVRWNGLVNDEKDSLLAYYIYYNYVRDQLIHQSSIGATILKAENAQKVSPRDKLARVFNRFIYLRGDRFQSRLLPTAYNLLNEYEDDPTDGYDAWAFTSIDRANAFGI